MMRQFRRLAALALFAVLLFGQGERGTITGTASDPSGGLMAGADITVRNLATNVTSRAKSNASGIYYVPRLLQASTS